MGPYQTLRAETWWTLLQITSRVFFMSRNPGNHKNRSTKSRDVLFQEKKAPARQPRAVVRTCFHQNPHKSIIFPINKEKYPTQNDATDDIYPLEPPKPMCLLKTIEFDEIWSNIFFGRTNITCFVSKSIFYPKYEMFQNTISLNSGRGHLDASF